VSAKIGVSPPSLTSFKSHGSKTLLDNILDIVLDTVCDILDTILDAILDILDAMLDIEFAILHTMLEVLLDIKILVATRHSLDKMLA
jgi:hypothetical protein